MSPESKKSCWDLENHAGIWKILSVSAFFFSGIWKFSLKIAGIGRIWLNPTRSSQIWSRSRQISSNLAWFCRFGRIFYTTPVGFGLLGFWRSKPTTRPAGVGSWERKPVADRLDFRFGLESGRRWVVWPGCQASIGSAYP